MKSNCLRLFYVVTLLLVAGASVVQAQTQQLFGFGSAWKYLDNGANMGTTWSAASFNDASWATGTGYFGYADSWINTCVNACGTVTCNPSCTNKYITTYFRKTININTASFDSVRLSLVRDDGAVVYVNGVEVWRDNMPSGTITYNTFSAATVDGANETATFTKNIPISAFVDGANVIAVEVHQRDGTSSDITFNMKADGYIRTQLFDYGSTWKYLATPTDQGTAWRSAGFNDAAWSAGAGHMGFGETWTTTCIPAGCGSGCNPGSCSPKYTTTYFRKVVNIPSTSFYDSIRFSVFRDDGIVVYVNGAEVWRDNMPSGTINYSTFAPGNVGATYAESTAVVKAIPISFFTPGDNTIAIELHQTTANSSDLDFNVRLTGVLAVPAVPVTLSQGPYLNMGNQSAMTLRWRTNVASTSRVLIGTVAGTYPIVVNDAAVVTEHEVRVTGLSADTKYYYRIGTDTSVIQGDTTNFFVTAPAAGSTRRVTVAAFGDCGRNDNGFQSGSRTAYLNYLASRGMKAADVMLLVGDNAYNNGTDAEFSSQFFGAYSGNILKNHVLFPAPGNHDYAQSAARQADHNVPYFSLFTMPTSGECGGVPSGTEAYYSYDWGNVHFLSLDSYGKEDAGTTRMYDTAGAQVTWIKNDLAANTMKWVVAYWHHPPFTKGSHNSDTEGELIDIRQKFIRILERYGVDLIICGHSHDYERSFLLKNYYGTEAAFNKGAHTADSSSARYNGTANSCPYMTESGKVNHGTVYVVSGSSGADGGVQSGYPHDALPFSIDDGGMFFFEVNDNRLDARFIRKDNVIADQFTIMKDVKVSDTVAILHGETVNLEASWVGSYAWGDGSATRAITVTATVDTMITVKDSLTNTCLVDKHYIDVQCTMPAFTSCPSDIVRAGCDATVIYSVADTGRPAPALSYSFSGATVGSGSGSGSGSTFAPGLTTVTITATNSCGSATCMFNVSVDPLPATVSVTGGGASCGAATLNASNGAEGTIYFQGTTAGGTSTVVPSVTETISASGTYYFRALGSDGCWSNDAPVNVTINAVPAAVTVSGAGAHCGAALMLATNGSEGTIYYQGLTAGGTSTAVPATTVSVTTSGTYYFRARTTAGCWGAQGGATVTVNPYPAVYSVVGGGSYCSGTGGLPVGLSGSQAGIAYQLYIGSSVAMPFVPGTGGAFTFGTFAGVGNYTVTAANLVSGCSIGMAGSASVAVNELPAVFAVTGGGSYCAGGTGVHVGLGGSVTGIAYQLYNGASPVGPAVPGTGVPLDFGAVYAAGVYTVQATNTATACVRNMAAAANVAVTPVVVPVVSISSSAVTAICAGTPASFAVIGEHGGVAPVYTWRVNGVPVASSATYGYTPANGDVVEVTMRSSEVCALPDSAVSAMTMAVDTFVTPSVTIAAVPGDTACAGDAVNFVATPVYGGTAPVYTWLKNSAVVSTAATYSVVPADGDNIILSMASNAHCRLATMVYSNSVGMTMLERYYPIVDLVVRPGLDLQPGMYDTLTAIATGGGPSPSYQWFKNSTLIPGATTNVYISNDFVNNDSVTCVVYGSGACGLPNLNYVVLRVSNGAAATTMKAAGCVVQPNPNGGEFVLKGAVAPGAVSVTVTNILGQSVYRREMTTATGIINEKIQLSSELPAGTYLLSVTSPAGMETHKLSIEK